MRWGVREGIADNLADLDAAGLMEEEHLPGGADAAIVHVRAEGLLEEAEVRCAVTMPLMSMLLAAAVILASIGPLQEFEGARLE